jgi:hypothetical protein
VARRGFVVNAPARLGRDRTAIGHYIEEIRVGKRVLVGLVVAVALVLSAPVGAFAASGTPVQVGTGSEVTGLSVAVEANGNAIASWADQSVPTANVVRWCVVPLGSGACAAGGTLKPAGNPSPQVSVYNTQVLVQGSTVAILADVAGGGVEYESVQQWQSTNGGLSFAATNAGGAIASGNTSVDTRMTNAIVLPGSLSVGVGFVTPSYQPTFHAYPLAGATLCGRAAGKCASGFATLGSEADVDKVSNPPANFATNGSSVLGVFRTNYSAGNFGCGESTPFGMAFIFGDGLQSPSNNYNVSPGMTETAWGSPVAKADCNVDYLAAGGGPSGYGVLEDNQATGQTQYHRFDLTNDTFDTAPNIVSATGEQQPSVSQDGIGGVYATYLSGGIGGPVSLSYSADGGTTWAGPATLAADPLGAVAGLTSSVGAAGQGWAAWSENGAVFVQPFVAADAGSPNPPSTGPAPVTTPGKPTIAPTTLSTSQKAGAQTGASITIPVGTTGETDQATIAGANAAHATGTVAYRLYESAGCTGTALSTSVVTTSGAVAPASQPVSVALAPGKYYWQATYLGDGANAASASSCGGEVLTIASPDEIAPTATSDGQSLTVGLNCTQIPCQVEIGLTAPAGAATAGSTKSKKPKSVVLGKGKFKIAKKGTQKLTVKLSGKGRAYLKGKRKAKVAVAVTQKVKGHKVVTARTVNVKVTPRRRAKR